MAEREGAAGEQIRMTHFSPGEMAGYEMKAYNEYFWIRSAWSEAYNAFFYSTALQIRLQGLITMVSYPVS